MKPKRLQQIESGFLFTCDYEDRDIAKTAGLSPLYEDKKFRGWFTNDVSKATLLAQYADAGTRAGLEAAQKSRAALIEGSKALDANLAIPAPPGQEYAGYQRAGVDYARRIYEAKQPGLKGLVLADQMGLGKTIQAIGMINLLAFQRVVIVVPASLKINWLRECEAWLTDKELRSRILIADSKTPGWLLKEYPIVIVNYDSLRAHMKLSGTKRVAVQSLGGFDLPWDFMIVDECHLIKGKSQRSKFTLALAKKARFVAMLTGTPIVNRPIEAWNALNAVAPGVFNDWWAYVHAYCDAQQSRFGLKTDGASNLDSFYEVTRSTCLIRRLKTDVMSELPPKRRQVIEVQPDEARLRMKLDEELQLWQENERTITMLRARLELAKSEEGQTNYNALKSALSQANSAAFDQRSRQRHELGRSKIPYAIRHLHDLIDEDDTAKVIVFAHHLDVIDALAKEFGSRAVTITGEVSAALKSVNGQRTSERQQNVDRFQNDPSVQLIIGGFQPMGTGWTLTASAHVLFVEIDDVPGNMLQAEDRAHRRGQQNAVLIQLLLFANSLDLRIAQNLIRKQEIIERALDQTVSDKDERIVPIPEASTKSLTRERLDIAADQLTASDCARIRSELQRLSAIGTFKGNEIDAAIAAGLLLFKSFTRKQAALAQALNAAYEKEV